jgi:glycosyltransferase involved in cell wall biosynthesis
MKSELAPRVVFVTNFCPHYRVRTFECLARRVEVQFLFFSDAQEWYWPLRYGQRQGDFAHEYLPGLTVGGTRIAPALLRRLWRLDYDIVIKCINGRFALPAAFLVARIRGKPFILWTGVWHRLQTPAHRLFHFLTRYIYRRADAMVVYGEHVRRFLIDEEGVPAERVFVAPHATDGDVYSQRLTASERSNLVKRLNLPRQRVVVLYAGRLESAKGVDDLLQAFLSLDDSRTLLLFVGEGSQREALEATVDRANAGARVRFVCGVPPESMPAYYALSDILVLPSRTTPKFKEPWGLVVNEAFYQGVAAITTNAVGAAVGGLVEQGVTGLIVPEGDASALASAIERLVENPELRVRLGEQARQRIQTWTNERMVDGFMRAIEHVRRAAGN